MMDDLSAKYALSLSQQEILLEQLLHPRTSCYHVGGSLVIQAGIKLDVMQQVMHRLVELNPLLTAVLVQEGAEYKLEYGRVSTQYFLDITAMEGLSLEEAEDYCRRDFSKPFDLHGSGPLYQIIGKSYSDRFLLYCKFHHILLDGFAFQVLASCFMDLYNQLSAAPHEIPIIQLGDYQAYSQKTNGYLQSPQYQSDRLYWKEKLTPWLEEDALIGRIAERKATSLTSKQLRLHYSQDVFNGLLGNLKEAGINPFHYSLAILGLAVCRAFHKKQFLLQVPIANRSGYWEKRTLGHFASVIHVLIDTVTTTTVESLVAAIGQDLRSSYKHQKFPVTHLHREFSDTKPLDQPFSEVMFSFEMQNLLQQFDGALASGDVFHPSESRLPLNVTVRNHYADRDVSVEFTYQEEAIAVQEMKCLMASFHELFIGGLDAIKTPIDQLFGKISFLEKEEIDFQLNQLGAGVPLTGRV